MGGGASRNPKFIEFLQSLQTILLKEYSAGNKLVLASRVCVYAYSLSTLRYFYRCDEEDDGPLITMCFRAAV